MMILQGGAGLFAASGEVTRDEWRAYFKYRQVKTFFPGIQGVGFSRVVQPSELARHIQGIRAEGFPGYTVWPAGERDVYTAIIFLEPFDARNRRVLGYDMFSEPVRRAAMERARDSGAVSISGKVTLVQETEKDVQTGFLMYVPVYAKGMPLNSVAERRAALEGYVYSPFRMNDLIRGIFPSLEHIIDHKIFDGAEVSPAGLMYDCDVHRRVADDKHKPMFSSRKTLDLYGHHWTLTFETNPLFETIVDQWKSWVVLAAGLVISLLAFLFIRALENTRKQAFSLAQKMTLALRQSEEKYRALNDSLPIGVSIIGPNMEILAVNATIRKWFPKSDDRLQPPCYAAYNIPPSTEPCQGCPVLKTFQDGQVHTAEKETTTLQGVRTMFITSVPLTDPDGKISSVHETLFPVRRAAEASRGYRKTWKNSIAPRRRSGIRHRAVSNPGGGRYPGQPEAPAGDAAGQGLSCTGICQWKDGVERRRQEPARPDPAGHQHAGDERLRGVRAIEGRRSAEGDPRALHQRPDQDNGQGQGIFLRRCGLRDQTVPVRRGPRAGAGAPGTPSPKTRIAGSL